MLPKWSDIKQLAKDLSKVRPKHVIALFRASQDDPSLKKALKKTRTRLLLGFAIGAVGTAIIITQTPPLLAAIGISLGSKIISAAFAGSAFKETLHAVREHKDEILSYLPGHTPQPPVNDNQPGPKLPDHIRDRFSAANEPEKKKTASKRRRKPGADGPAN